MISVDRLVFDIPGMSPARAERLAHAIGAMLPSDVAPTAHLAVTLPRGADDDAAILAALAAALKTGAR